MDDLREAWEREGYVLLRGAAPGEALAAYGDEVAAAREGLLARTPGDDQVSLATQLPPGGPGGIVDPYAVVETARALLLSPALVAFLTTVLGEAPVLFDAVETGAGPLED